MSSVKRLMTSIAFIHPLQSEINQRLNRQCSTCNFINKMTEISNENDSVSRPNQYLDKGVMIVVIAGLTSRINIDF